MNTKVLINGKPIGEFKLYVDKKASECANFSALEIQRYVKATTGDILPLVTDRPDGAYIEFAQSKATPDFPAHDKIEHDGFAFCVDGDHVKIYAKEDRGVLYGAYELLEKMGWRFLAQRSCQRGMEWHDYMLPCEINKNAGETTDVKLECYVNNPAMFYRDSINYCNFEEDFCAKIRLNAETWGSRKFGALRGDALGFAGPNGHSFGFLVPVSEYGESHPEYFAEINGVRDTKLAAGDPPGLGTAQLCMTNEEIVPIIVEKLKEYAKTAHPARKVVSVSQNDNTKFCTCEKCKKAYAERGGIGGVLVDLVNKVAVEFEKTHPDFIIHTYLYWGTAEAVMNKDIKFHHNVMPQYCITHCHNHAIDDPTCNYNVHANEILEKVGRLTDNLFIWDYRSPLGSALAIVPNIRFLRQNMLAMARNNVKGIYAEMALFNFCTPNLEELRSYLYGKLTWNPYMSEEEYQEHIDDFLMGFYGKGWRHVKEMIEYYENACAGKHHINMTPDRFELRVPKEGEVLAPQDSKIENRQRGLFFDRDKAEEICEHCRELLEKARKEGNAVNRHRINILDTGIIWLQLHLLMEEKVKLGGAEKDKYVKLNVLLLENMRIYCMKYTTEIGMRNIQFMYDGKYELPVSYWDSPAAYGGVE